MSCETIAVTNTVSNDICSGEYEKSPDVQQWINTNNPSCRVAKVYNNSESKWEWVFNVVVPAGSAQPPGSTPVYSAYTPRTFEITTVGVDQAIACAGSAESVNTTSAHSATTATSWQTSLASGAVTKYRRCQNGALVESDYSSKVYSRIAWILPSYDSQLTDSENLNKLYQIDILTQNGTNEVINAGFCFPESTFSVSVPHFVDNSRTVDYTVTAQSPTEWSTSYWETTANDGFFNLIHRNESSLSDCWGVGWKLAIEVKSDTTANSSCPSDADWSGTGLTVTASSVNDFDGDGIPDETDPDDDNDGVLDINDNFPKNASRASGNDFDGDGIDDEFDTDDDNDGVLDINDNFPKNANRASGNDFDGDGIDDEFDTDDDNDGLPDSEDPKPKDPTNGPNYTFTGATVASKYKGYVFNERMSALAGPFDAEDISTITTKDNSSDMYCVTRGNEIKKTVLTDFNDPNFPTFNDPFTDIENPLTSAERGVILSKTGEGFLYRGRYKSDPFADSIIGEGAVKQPLFFRNSYLAIAETHWMHLGDEHNEKQIHRVDLRFHKNSCGHLFLYVQNEEGKTKGQYKGVVKEHMKVFTNIRGRSFKLCLMVATHKEYPWALREMSIGHLYGKSF